MNTDQKHIESCRAEDPLAQTMEACGNESDLQAALQPLLVETMPGYVPVATTAPTSPIAELPGVLISIIRRVATKPLTILGERPAKQSLLGSLVTTWNAIRNRLSGNPSLGIPDRRAEMTAHSLPTALALLNDRKITGVPDAADGISLVHLLMSSAREDITEITDDNTWGSYRNFDFISLFPNLSKLTIGCESVSGFTMFSGKTNLSHFAMPHFKSFSYYAGIFHNSFTADTELEFPEWETIVFGSNFSPCMQGNKFKKFSAPKMKIVRSTGTNSPCFYDSPNLEEIDMPALEYCNHLGVTERGGGLANNCPKLWKVRVGDLSYGTISGTSGTSANGMGFPDCPKLIHLELGANGVDVSVSVDMRWWSPTLDSSNLQQFLLNFRNFIALRLANRKDTTALTLTLSAAVYNAVTGANSGWASLHTLAELGITTDYLTELEQELGITTATLYSTWLDTYTGANGIHWNVNKAN